MNVKKIVGLSVFVIILFMSFLPMIMGEYTDNMKSDDRKVTVILDAGHGGKDGGAQTATGIHEKEIVLNITKKVEQYLRMQGFEVVLTRDGDYDLASPDAKKRKMEDLNKRISIFNNTPNAIMVSIHGNSIPDTKWKGAQSFYDPKKIENKKLGVAMMNSLQANLENTSREPKSISNIYILKNSNIPSTLVEVGFLSNPDEAALLLTDEYQDRVAYSIFEGILYYLDNPDMNLE